MFDPVEAAHKSPYFKRNHVGKVVCTLCNIYCNDENAFMNHLSGKTHTQQVESKERRERRRRRLEEEDRICEEARLKEQQEHMTQKLASATASSLTSSGVTLVSGRFGEPEYRFRTEHHPIRFETKVWLEFLFPFAEDGTRPLHRWLSAREQSVDVPPDNYYVYLLVACEGYTTVAVKFPAEPLRTTSESPMMTSWASTLPALTPADGAKMEGSAKDPEKDVERKADGEASADDPTVVSLASPSTTATAVRTDHSLESVYLANWDAARKVYHLYFVMSR